MMNQRRVPNVLRRVLQLAAVGSAAIALGSSLQSGGKGAAPFSVRSTATNVRETTTARRTLRSMQTLDDHRTLSIGGVRLTTSARAGLVKLVNMWERYDDLKRYTTDALTGEPSTKVGSSGTKKYDTVGIPNVFGLIDWAMSTTDSRSVELLPWQGSFQELSDIYGRVRANGDVLGPLIARSNARRHKSVNADAALFVVAEKIRERPDLQKRFVQQGFVDLRAIAEWASTVGASDPDRQWLLPRVADFARLLGDISS